MTLHFVLVCYVTIRVEATQLPSLNRFVNICRGRSHHKQIVKRAVFHVFSLPEDDVIDSCVLPRFAKPRHSSEKTWTPVPVNSHLINQRVLPRHRCASMADLRLTESEIKSRITLAHIMDELGE